MTVYFLQAMGRPAVKIGRTDGGKGGVGERRDKLQTGSLDILDCLGVLTERPGGFTEQSVHQRFAHLNIHGEWFILTDEIRLFIAKECRGAGLFPKLTRLDPMRSAPPVVAQRVSVRVMCGRGKWCFESDHPRVIRAATQRRYGSSYIYVMLEGISAAIRHYHALHGTKELVVESENQFLADVLAKGVWKKWRSLGWKYGDGRSVPDAAIWEQIARDVDVTGVALTATRLGPKTSG